MLHAFLKNFSTYILDLQRLDSSLPSRIISAGKKSFNHVETISVQKFLFRLERYLHKKFLHVIPEIEILLSNQIQDMEIS